MALGSSFVECSGAIAFERIDIIFLAGGDQAIATDIHDAVFVQVYTRSIIFPTGRCDQVDVGITRIGGFALAAGGPYKGQAQSDNREGNGKIFFHSCIVSVVIIDK